MESLIVKKQAPGGWNCCLSSERWKNRFWTIFF